MKTKQKKQKEAPQYLLEGKIYIPAAQTDIRKTLAKFGFVPPSEVRK
jgi:hypothetical protein